MYVKGRKREDEETGLNKDAEGREKERKESHNSTESHHTSAAEEQQQRWLPSVCELTSGNMVTD